MSAQEAIPGRASPTNAGCPEAEYRSGVGTTPAPVAPSEVDARALLHELQVHQIELEMQNAALQRAQVEARAAGEKYADLFDFAPLGYFLLDEEGRMQELNLAAAALLGGDRAALAQKQLIRFVAFLDRAVFTRFCQQVLHSEAKQTCEVRLLREEQTVSVLLKGIAARAPHGSATFSRVAAIDITERKQAEERLRLLNAQLGQSASELARRAAQLRTMATTLAQAEQSERRRLSKLLHDHFQQLLVAARLKLGLLRRRIPQEETLVRTVSEAEQLIDECVQDSRSLAVELSPPILHERGLAQGLEWLARHMEGKYGMTIQVVADRLADPTDESLRVFLFQTVRELLFNVVKHARAQQTRVQMTRTDTGSLCIEVRDDGVGCDLAQFRGPSSTASGLGLLSLRERMECLGGQLDVVTAPGQGMQVVISLLLDECPLAAVPPVVAQVPYTAAASPAALRDNRELRVLVADDHPEVRRHLAELLREQGGVAEVLEAADGQEAVTLAVETHPDLVLMDVTMPRMDGIEATRQIKAVLPQMPVLALSMHQDAHTMEAMYAAGASDYLCKDVFPEALLTAIQRYA